MDEDEFFSPYGYIVIAGFDDECTECYDPIVPGEHIRSYGQGFVHERCPYE